MTAMDQCFFFVLETFLYHKLYERPLARWKGGGPAPPLNSLHQGVEGLVPTDPG